jgi:hypothetical protein
MYTTTILCFANSWKRSGTCVAGRVLLETLEIGGWMRPISSRPTHAISLAERRYADGSYADVLDLIEIRLTSHVPTMHQTENHLIDPSAEWRKIGAVTWGQVQVSLDTIPAALWVNGYSTAHGINDKVPLALLPGISDSLKLLSVPDFTVRVAYEPGYQGAPGRRRVRASFTLNGLTYRLAVTDPLVAQIYLNKPDGDYAIGPATLCLSLSEPEFGYAFKLVATVLTAHRCTAA